MGRIKSFFLSYIQLDTVDDAIKLNLKHRRNVHGDEINRLDYRSVWEDEYKNFYYCDELFLYDSIIKQRKHKIRQLLVRKKLLKKEK